MSRAEGYHFRYRRLDVGHRDLRGNRLVADCPVSGAGLDGLCLHMAMLRRHTRRGTDPTQRLGFQIARKCLEESNSEKPQPRCIEARQRKTV